MRMPLVVVMAGSRWMKTRWTLIPVDHSVVCASKNRFVRFCMLMTTFVMKYNHENNVNSQCIQMYPAKNSEYNYNVLIFPYFQGCKTDIQ
jgi:hypothetical protein